MSPLLQVSHIHKSFDGAPLLRDVSFDVAPSEIVCLLGPSGCGKTTLLNIIAGLEQAESGQVLVEGQDISGVPVHRRGFGLMFQDLALFPHKNVRDNVAFGLRMAGLAPQAIDARVSEVLELVGLAGFEQRDVNQLSGGEQQRVALARSLAPRPRLLMLDEPLSSLDRTLRERLMNELRDILTRVGQTAIYVTHDQQEAFALADRVVILNAGRVAQIGTPQEVYRAPADAFVARFLGLTNLIRGWRSEGGGRESQDGVGDARRGGRRVWRGRGHGVDSARCGDTRPSRSGRPRRSKGGRCAGRTVVPRRAHAHCHSRRTDYTRVRNGFDGGAASRWLARASVAAPRGHHVLAGG